MIILFLLFLFSFGQNAERYENENLKGSAILKMFRLMTLQFELGRKQGFSPNQNSLSLQKQQLSTSCECIVVDFKADIFQYLGYIYDLVTHSFFHSQWREVCTSMTHLLLISTLRRERYTVRLNRLVQYSQCQLCSPLTVKILLDDQVR